MRRKEIISKIRKDDMNRLIGFVERKIAIHREIMKTHTSYPKDWHEGNIKALSDLLEYLQNIITYQIN